MVVLLDLEEEEEEDAKNRSLAVVADSEQVGKGTLAVAAVVG